MKLHNISIQESNDSYIAMSGFLKYHDMELLVWKVTIIKSCEVYYFLDEECGLEEAIEYALLWNSIDIISYNQSNSEYTNETNNMIAFDLRTSAGSITVGYGFRKAKAITIPPALSWPNGLTHSVFETLAKAVDVSNLKKGELFSMIGPHQMQNLTPDFMYMNVIAFSQQYQALS